MWTRSIVMENQRGLLVVNGRVRKWLEPGAHRVWRRSTTIELLDLDKGFEPYRPELANVIPSGAAEELFVDHGEIALISKDGLPHAVLEPGRYLLWQLRGDVRALTKSTAQVVSDIPVAYSALIADRVLKTWIVPARHVALVYENGRLIAQLTEGAYVLHQNDRVVDVQLVDLREQELTITSQEVMTQDKVSLRMNIVVRYAVSNAQATTEATDVLYRSLYTEAQLVARRMVAGRSLDDLLEQRSEAADVSRGELAERAEAWGLRIVAFDLKDIILPGEMKTLLNKVLEAEKQAAAIGILRREETASTRSLANTARMLEQNPMLLRLKELETAKDLAERVGSLTLVSSPGDLLKSLSLNTAK